MFYLAPHPKLDRPRRGSPLMFTVPWVEKYLSRVRPWHVIAIWAPVARLGIVVVDEESASTALRILDGEVFVVGDIVASAQRRVQILE